MLFVLDNIFLTGYIPSVEWEIEFSDEFGTWWDRLTEDEQDSVDQKVRMLMKLGPALRRPHVGPIATSKYPNMKELIVQHEGRPYRVLFAFNPLRNGILLIGGDKTGNDRWYEEHVPRADQIYAEHLLELLREGKIHA